MSKFCLYIGLIVAILIAVNGQQFPDYAWCNIQGNFQNPNLTFTGRYQALVERNDLETLRTEEIREFFDGIDNIGIAIQTDGSSTIRTYSYYNLKELLVVQEDKTCQVFPLDNPLIEAITPFYSVKNDDGSLKIVSPLQHVIEKNAQLKYVGNSTIRGITVDNYQLCSLISSKDGPQTVRYTLSVTNNWVPAEKFNANINSVVPVQLKAEKKRGVFVDQDVYSIHEYRPYLLLTEEGYFTPPGVVCEGKFSSQDLPPIPRQFSFLMETVNSLTNGIEGFITRTREAYDIDAGLFKQTANTNNGLITQLDDFQTGIRYTINEFNRTCFVDKIDPAGIDATSDQNGFVTIRNPEEFFDFDNANYTYTGKRKINGVNTDVWIAYRKFKGIDSVFEWAFLDHSFDRLDFLNKPAPTPVKLTMDFLENVNGTIIRLPLMFSFTNFRIEDRMVAHTNIENCRSGYYHPIDSGSPNIRPNFFHPHKKTFQIAFETTDDLTDLVSNNRELFKASAYRACQSAAKVTHLRLQNLEVTTEKNHVFFVFSILEKSRFYGNVLIPRNDVSLEDAAFHVGDAVKNGKLRVDFEPLDKNFVTYRYTLTANPDGFREIEDPEDRYVILKTVSHPYGYTGATVGVASTIVALVGLILVMSLLILHKNQKIKLPFL